MLSPQESELDRRRDNEVPGDPARGAHHAGLDGAEEQTGGLIETLLKSQKKFHDRICFLGVLPRGCAVELRGRRENLGPVQDQTEEPQVAVPLH